MLASRVGFSGTADRLDLFLVGPNPRWLSFVICTRKQNVRAMTIKCDNFQNLEMQNGGRAPYRKVSVWAITRQRLSDLCNILYEDTKFKISNRSV